MKIHGIEVKGTNVDPETRCKHYSSEKDIIAIKFPCCQTYYPCFQCHKEGADHPALAWKKEQWHEKAILCGKCGAELTIIEYMGCNARCPKCEASFNPGCRNHYHLYFEN
ncbi:hypothetical protein DNHGIG_21220 [Collibacillus ludicampi]|jgi:uncharacterized CHY-type Zn-finger protein|uniref:CHY-type domain-containing protein n=1 Tax=Collibacillus ludicampi TaxID=2771369 RepID=A0AAV4LFZ3_9BACL|nr:CHY zinc finger protein [Collibacillus ludicampi]GIM46573.1 hypothetical protein DNHGIG_21220 [Collibacillus ludicampi]